MLRLPRFDLRRPGSVAEAAQIIYENPGRAMLMAGGTDLLPNLKRRQFEPEMVVSLQRLEELHTITTTDRELELGAGLTLHRLARDETIGRDYRALAMSAGKVATPQIQRMGTLGGNICIDTRCNYYNQTEEWRRAIGYCMKKDGTTCLVAPGSKKCWAISSSDTAPVLIALGAEVILADHRSKRRLSLHELYRDDGIEYLTKRPEEILTSVVLPVAAGQRSTYRKVRRRGSFDFPILGVAASLTMKGDLVSQTSLVLGAVQTHPLVVPEAADLMVGESPSLELIEAVAAAAQRRSTPLDNADLTLYWRKSMVRVEVRRALLELTGLTPD